MNWYEKLIYETGYWFSNTLSRVGNTMCQQMIKRQWVREQKEFSDRANNSDPVFTLRAKDFKSKDEAISVMRNHFNRIRN